MTGQVLTTPFAEQAHGPGDAWNVAAYLPVIAQRVPDQPAVVVTCGRGRGGRARYAELTFRQLEEQSNRYANGLTEIGIGRGMRVLVMVRPGLEFIGLIFALFKMGTVPILIDPGMGVRRMLACVRMVEPEAFVGIPVAHVVRLLVLGRSDAAWAGRAIDRRVRDSRYARRRNGSHPLYQRQHGPAQGCRLQARHVRRPGACHSLALRHRAG